MLIISKELSIFTNYNSNHDKLTGTKVGGSASDRNPFASEFSAGLCFFLTFNNTNFLHKYHFFRFFILLQQYQICWKTISPSTAIILTVFINGVIIDQAR